MPSDLRSAVLAHVNDPNYQPVKPAVIAKKLGLANEAAHELKKTIKRMVKAGELAWGPSHLIQSVERKPTRKRTADISFGEPAAVAGHDTRQKRKTKSRPSGESKH